ncbi:MAG: family 1 glycosylhydrolase, partial [Chitinophagaceae bacterium]
MNKKSHCTKPEIWGGMECTINRVGDVYRDQLEETGHYERQDDLNKLCTLGFTKFRYPILWERHFPKEEKMQEWAWTTNQLNILRQRNITPIAGLIHHGSGPLHTDLLDMDFPVKLAAYAKQVAETFPWINYYTPVNEPLTTARFSGLYGFWYPHVKTDAGFVRMLINQLKGVVLSMQAIRKINPEATLVQTEDLSKTYSTPALAYQADFENQRRWLTYDLLTASVNEEHAAWKYFTANGIDEDELFFFLENPCPPGIAGFNYYVTSERFLDERIEHYPVHTHGHNHVQAYADTEAARSGHMKGAANLLAEAWWRYKIPLALTECQLACTREQQMKWFYQHFKIAENLCQQHIPVTGITAWGLLGAVDWNSLICLNNGQYESGAFEINKQKLRPTALATMIRTLSKRKDYHHPALDGKGWWQTGGSMAFESSTPLRAGSGKRLVIIDNDSRTGRILAGLCNQRNLLYRIISSGDAARADHHRLANAVDNYSPWAIVNLCEPLVRSNTELPGIFLEKEQRDHRSVIVHPSRIIQLLQLSADQSTAAEHCNPPDIELLFHRLNADNLPNYFSEHLTEKVSVGEAIDIKINDDQMTELINKALDLLIDNFEGIWHFKQETKDYQLIS